MNRVYKGYPGGDTLYHVNGNELYEPYGGAPVATFRDDHIFYGRRVDSRPAATIRPVGNGEWEIFQGWGNVLGRIGYTDGEHLMDCPNGEVLMSMDHYDPAGLAMACAMRYGDDSLREFEDMRLKGTFEEPHEFHSYATENAWPGESPVDYEERVRRQAGADNESNLGSASIPEWGGRPGRREREGRFRRPTTGVFSPDNSPIHNRTPEEIREERRKRYPLAKRISDLRWGVAKGFSGLLLLVCGLLQIWEFVEGELTGAFLFGTPLVAIMGFMTIIGFGEAYDAVRAIREFFDDDLEVKRVYDDY